MIDVILRNGVIMIGGTAGHKRYDVIDEHLRVAYRCECGHRVANRGELHAHHDTVRSAA